MRIIKEFKWCKKYNLDQVEIEYDANKQSVIIYRANRVTNIKCMIEVIRWARTFPEYRQVLCGNILRYLIIWLFFNLKQKRQFDYLQF